MTKIKRLFYIKLLSIIFAFVFIPFVVLWAALGIKVMGIGFFIFTFFLILVALALAAKLD